MGAVGGGDGRRSASDLWWQRIEKQKSRRAPAIGSDNDWKAGAHTTAEGRGSNDDNPYYDGVSVIRAAKDDDVLRQQWSFLQYYVDSVFMF